MYCSDWVTYRQWKLEQMSILMELSVLKVHYLGMLEVKWMAVVYLDKTALDEQKKPLTKIVRNKTLPLSLDLKNNNFD